MTRVFLEEEANTGWSMLPAHPLQFDILRLHGGRYRGRRKQLGWVRSEVFERWFRLTQQAGPDGFPDYTLEVREDKPG